MKDWVVRNRNKFALALGAVLLIAVLVVVVVFRDPLIGRFRPDPFTGGQVLSSRAGALEVDAVLRPDPPGEQGNRLYLDVEAAGDEPVEGADVEVTAVMPAMGAMPEMRAEADVRELGDGRYVAAFDLPMGGGWTLETHIEAPEGSATLRYGMTVGTPGLTEVSATGTGAPAAGPPPEEVPSHTFPDPALHALREAFVAYDALRGELAAGEMDEVALHADRVSDSLAFAEDAAGDAPEPIEAHIRAAVEAAEALSRAEDVETAREHFSPLSRHLIALAAADPRLAEGYHVFSCPMEDDYPKWFQASDQLANPYMGPDMLTCGEPATWTEGPAGPAPSPDEIAYYTCPMHPSVKSEDPDTCPICRMDLTPVTQAQLEAGTVFVDAVRRQRFGVTTETVQSRTLTRDVRAVGHVTYDERRRYEVTPRTSGYVERLFVEEPGTFVRKGQRLFAMYSPELFAAQQEFVLAQDSAVGGAQLAEAARIRLDRFGVSEAQIEDLRRTGEVPRRVVVEAPASGIVVEKNVVEGAQVEPGQRVFEIADIRSVWIEAAVYEDDVPLLEPGMPALVELPYLPGETLQGSVTFLDPRVDMKTRTVDVRVEIDNTRAGLLPGMYANVLLEKPVGPMLTVPQTAVIFAGPRRLVFVDLGEGRLQPREIVTGLKGDGWYEVVSGLREGEVVVSSGVFLIAAESRLGSAARYWGNDAAD